MCMLCICVCISVRACMRTCVHIHVLSVPENMISENTKSLHTVPRRYYFISGRLSGTVVSRVLKICRQSDNI